MVVYNAPIGPPRLIGLVVMPGSSVHAVLVAAVSGSQWEGPQAGTKRALREDGSAMGLNVQRLAVTSLSAHDREETRGFHRPARTHVLHLLRLVLPHRGAGGVPHGPGARQSGRGLFLPRSRPRLV